MSVKPICTRMNVWNSLLIRALMARYGHGNFGFLWLILEPLLLITGVSLVWSIIYGSTRHGILIIPFVLTGYSMLTLWRHVVGHSVHVLRRNADLLYHRQIGPGDVMVPHYWVEIVGVLISFFTAYVVALLMGVTTPIDDYLTLLGGWFLMSFFCVGIGLIVAGMTEMSDVAERFVPPLLYLALPLSGAFTMVAWLPRGVQDFLLYVPMVHATEMFRAGYYGEAVPTHWDAGYLFYCGLVANVVGLVIFSKAMHQVETS